MQNLSNWLADSFLRAVPVWLSATLGVAGAVHAADTCKGIAIPSKHFIYVADAKFQKVRGTQIQLGNVTPPAKVAGMYYVISSKDLTPDSLIGGRDMEHSLDTVKHPCKRVNIAAITFNFGDSILPPGEFWMVTPFFGTKDNGRGDIEVEANNVVGHIWRVWFEASIQPTEKNGFEITLTNTGNLPTTPLNFDEKPDYWPIKLVTNACQGRTLQPAESCSIKMTRRTDNVAANADEKWHFSFDSSKAHCNLELDAKGLRVYVSIPRFISEQ